MSTDSLEEWRSDTVLAEVVPNVGQQEAPVTVVGHVTSVVYASDEILDGVPRCVFVLVQVDVE